MDNLVLYNKLASVPDNLKNQVGDFIDFLTSKNRKEKTNLGKPKFGSGKGMFIIKPNFNEPLEDFKEYM